MIDPAADQYGRNATITELGHMAWTCYQELRVKRDAIALVHKQIRFRSDRVQKLIMALGMFTAAFESCRESFTAAYTWSDRANAWLTLVPVTTSTAVAALTAAQRYWRYAERLEALAQTRSDSQSVINSLREFMQEHRVQSTPAVEARCEFRVIAVQYNRALDNIETLTYPDDRRYSFVQAYRYLHPPGRFRDPDEQPESEVDTKTAEKQDPVAVDNVENGGEGEGEGERDALSVV